MRILHGYDRHIIIVEIAHERIFESINFRKLSTMTVCRNMPVGHSEKMTFICLFITLIVKIGIVLIIKSKIFSTYTKIII